MKKLPLFLQALNGTVINGFTFTYTRDDAQCVLEFKKTKFYVSPFENGDEGILVIYLEDKKEVNKMVIPYSLIENDEDYLQFIEDYISIIKGLTASYHEVNFMKFMAKVFNM